MGLAVTDRNDWSQWHTIRATGTQSSTNPDHSDVKVYVDGVYQGDYVAFRSYGERQVSFGDSTCGSANGPPLIEWDYIAYSAEGAFAPQQVVPEPLSMAFMGSAFVGVVAWRARRRRRRKRDA